MARAPNEKSTAPQTRAAGYKGLAASLNFPPVDAARVEREIGSLRLRAAVWEDTTARAARGDRLTISFAGFWPDGTPIPGSSAADIAAVLGSGRLMPGVEPALCGHKAGETVELPYTYPAGFRLPELAGKNAVFQSEIHAVSRKTLPAADDAFARAQGCADMAALREKLRMALTEKRARLAAESAKTALLEKAGENLEGTLTDAQRAEIERQAEQSLAGQEAALRAAGETPEAFYARTGHARAWHKARAEAAAEKQMRARLAVEAVARAEDITVSEEEMRAEQKRIGAAPRARQTDESALRQAVLTRKVKNFLLAHASISGAAPAAGGQGRNISEG